MISLRTPQRRLSARLAAWVLISALLAATPLEASRSWTGPFKPPQDEMGRLTKTTFPDNTPDPSDNPSEESTYDPEGRRLTSKDRAGRITTYEYDANGRLTFTRFPAPEGETQPFTENRYDDAGRLVQTIDARLKSTFYEYDEAGRRTLVRDPFGNETLFGYDANGNQTTVRDARLNTTTNEYDALNRRTKTIFPDTTYTETTYDALGRRTAERDQAGKIARFEYDKVGRLKKVIDPAAGETTYFYDQLGNRILQRDANGHETTFEYDKLGRETKRCLPDGSCESKEYDLAGNLIRRVDFMGRVTEYTYDENNRVLTRTYPTDPTQNVSFTYTPTGRRKTGTDARGTTSYDYDLRDRLTSLTYPDGRKLEYTYDANGNRETLTAVLVDSTRLTTTYSYDDASRLDTVTDPLARITDYAYDPNGNRDTLAHPNGVQTTYTYDTLNRLTNIATVHAPSAQTVASYALTLGLAGNRTRIDEAGGTVKEYGYDDDLYRLTTETVTNALGPVYAKTFVYDNVGNRESQTTTGSGVPGTPTAPGTITYTYDTRDRLTAEGSQTHTWDANGNLTAKTAEATYTWDRENRLIHVEKPDGTVVANVYDADGTLVRKTTTLPGQPPEFIDYLVDTSGGLSHVVAETTATGTLTALYVRGLDDLLTVMRPDGSGGYASRFHHADHIGSIRRLTDEIGNPTDSYELSAFGELIEHTGTDPQPYLFAGEPYDPNVGFAYHRARWMDPSTARFAAIDPYRGDLTLPGTLHPYVYAAMSPVDKSDPTGEFSIAATLPVVATFNVTQAMSVINAIAVVCAVNATLGAVGIDPSEGGVNPCNFNPIREITVYRGLNGTNPGQFRFDWDGLSVFEVLPAGYKFAFPFRVRYREPKRPFLTTGRVVAPTIPFANGRARYTPSLPGHWSITYPFAFDLEGIKKALALIAKQLFG